MVEGNGNKHHRTDPVEDKNFKKNIWQLQTSGEWQKIQEISEIGGCSSMVEPQPSKLKTRVRYPSPALVEPKEVKTKGALKKRYDWGCAASKKLAAVAQLVERVLGKDEVMGSNPISSSGKCKRGLNTNTFSERVCSGLSSAWLASSEKFESSSR